MKRHQDKDIIGIGEKGFQHKLSTRRTRKGKRTENITPKGMRHEPKKNEKNLIDGRDKRERHIHKMNGMRSIGFGEKRRLQNPKRCETKSAEETENAMPKGGRHQHKRKRGIEWSVKEEKPSPKNKRKRSRERQEKGWQQKGMPTRKRKAKF